MDLHITSLGMFDIRAGDESLLEPFGRSYRIFKLLHYFLTYRNKKLLAESIMDNLFQDNDCYDPKNTLRGQIFRLRQILKQISPEGGDEKDYMTINFSNGYYILELGKKVSLDIDIFESLIQEGDRLKESNIGQAIGAYKKAIEMYKGGYLDEDPYEIWLVPTRNYYNRIYIKSLFSLLELLKEKDRHEEIIEICEDSLIHANEEEAIHLYIMDAMLKLGQVKNALSHYEYALPLFSNEGGNIVSPAMKNIYTKIQNHFTENRRINIGEIEAALEEEEEEGPLFCHMDYFKFIYSSRKRTRSHRDERDYVCIINLNGEAYTKDEIQAWFSIVRNILEKSLRKGDLFTFWNDSQAIVLLTDVRSGGLEAIEERIYSKLKDHKKYSSNLKCTHISGEEFQ